MYEQRPTYKFPKSLVHQDFVEVLVTITFHHFQFSFISWFFSRRQYTGVIWNKVFKNGASKFCERQSLKNLKWSLHILSRLSSANFSWSIIEYLDPYVVLLNMSGTQTNFGNSNEESANQKPGLSRKEVCIVDLWTTSTPDLYV